jgi:hypothetical protein
MAQALCTRVFLSGAVMNNPANVPTNAAPEKKRIPLSIPSRKLEVAEIPGWHLYWFLESNVPRAVQGGYVFVKDEEVTLNQHNVAADKSISGNVDLGSQVKVVGGVSESGGAEHLVLMKIKQEWYDEDKRAIEAKNASVMAAIFRDEAIPGGEPSLAGADTSNRYVSTALFNRPVRKGK